MKIWKIVVFVIYHQRRRWIF